MPGVVQDDHSVIFTGPPVTPEMQLLLGGYAGGKAVAGIVALQEGLHVSFDDGTKMLFVALPEGMTLCSQPDGGLVVK